MQSACFRTCCRALLNDWWKRPLKDNRALKRAAVPHPAIHTNRTPTPPFHTHTRKRNSIHPSLGGWRLLIFWCQLVFIKSLTHAATIPRCDHRKTKALSSTHWHMTGKKNERRLPPQAASAFQPVTDFLFSCVWRACVCVCVFSECKKLTQTRSRGLNRRSERSCSRVRVSLVANCSFQLPGVGFRPLWTPPGCKCSQMASDGQEWGEGSRHYGCPELQAWTPKNKF